MTEEETIVANKSALPQTRYPDCKVLIPTYGALIGCPRCGSRNTRTFPDVYFMDNDFPKKESNFIHIQGQCNDCKTLLLISVRQYMIDVTVAEPNPPKKSFGNFKMRDETVEPHITEYGHLHFAGTTVDVGGDDDDSARADEEEHRCEWCGLPYHTERGLHIHQAHCPLKPEEVKQREQEEEEELEREEEERVNEVIAATKRAEWYKGHKKRIDDMREKEEEQEWKKCSFCGEEFTTWAAVKKHQKTECKGISEEGHNISHVSVEQNPEDIDKSIIYTYSDATPVTLFTDYGIKAYRKEITRCPHCDYEMDDWEKPPHVKEVCFWIDTISLDFFFRDPAECAVLISECPKCFKKSMGHPRMTTLLWDKWFDHRKIIDVLVERGFAIEGEDKDE